MLSTEKQIVYLISCASVIEVQELVLLYEADGRSGQYIRNVLARLKKMGYIESAIAGGYSQDFQFDKPEARLICPAPPLRDILGGV